MHTRITALFLIAIIGAAETHSQITITLRKSFIDSFKNKVTITIPNFGIYEAHEHPNSASKDADLHFAGTGKPIGMPMVAEIMNAKGQQSAVDEVHAFEGDGEPQNTVT